MQTISGKLKLPDASKAIAKPVHTLGWHSPVAGLSTQSPPVKFSIDKTDNFFIVLIFNDSRNCESGAKIRKGFISPNAFQREHF